MPVTPPITRLLVVLLLLASTEGQINFGGSSSGGRPSSSSSSGGGGGGGSPGIEFGSSSSPKDLVKGLQGGRETLATVLSAQGVRPEVEVGVRATTRRVGSQCNTPQGTAGSCQYIFASQCRPILTAILTNGVTQQLLQYLLVAIRSPCGFQSFDFTLCCEDPNSPISATTTTTTQRPVTTVTTQQPVTTTTTTQRPVTTTTTTTQPPPQELCGTNSRQRIVGGTIARQGDWPWAVVLGTQGFGGRFNVQCGGTLIDQTTVLTAAHCFDQSGGPTVVRLGDHDLTTSSDGALSVDISILRSIQHPGWDRNALSNDIAIVKLSRPVQFNRDIKRACLPTRYHDANLPVILANPQPQVVGWGSTSTGGGPTNILRQASVQMVTQQQCAEAYRAVSRVTIGITKLCAGEGTRDTCNGDSGGGLFSRNLGGGFAVLGVTSFGVECARPDFPGVYTRVDEYLPWIEANMG